MTSQSDKAAAFTALHAGPGVFVIPNPWDAGSAKILAQLGFKALAHAGAIVAATDLPVSADLENLYGDAPAVCAETIRQAAAAGLAGCSIEDTTGHADDPIYPFDLALARVQAAVAAARALPFPFTLTARAENFLHGRPDMADTA